MRAPARTAEPEVRQFAAIGTSSTGTPASRTVRRTTSARPVSSRCDHAGAIMSACSVPATWALLWSCEPPQPASRRLAAPVTVRGVFTRRRHHQRSVGRYLHPEMGDVQPHLASQASEPQMQAVPGSGWVDRVRAPGSRRHHRGDHRPGRAAARARRRPVATPSRPHRQLAAESGELLLYEAMVAARRPKAAGA